MTIKPKDSIYFIGIGGTGMASVAGLAKEAGYQVSGSDGPLYPPMSTMLESLNIPVYSPYDPKNIKHNDHAMFIIANALSRGHKELEAALESHIPYASFPQFLGEYILEGRSSIVVSGTHGKTTTTSLLAHVLKELGEQPGYMIGGIPKGFDKGFSLGCGSTFVIEGDEYDTAFFDKNSKFLHYRPQYLIFNNLEFDHADIFSSLEDIEKQFTSLLRLVPLSKNIIANADDKGVMSLLDKLEMTSKVTLVSTLGKRPDAPFIVEDINTRPDGWSCKIALPTKETMRIKTALIGEHNVANMSQVLATLYQLMEQGVIQKAPRPAIEKAFASFQGVSRRLDHLATVRGIDIYEDFAHHPTSVSKVIESFKSSHPEKKIIVAFEPRNATSRRNIFAKDFAQSLKKADRVLIGHCPVDNRIPADERMDTEALAKLIGDKAKAYSDNNALVDSLAHSLVANDVVIFMSSGSFGGVQYQLSDKL